ncbi:MAG TPA: alkaline phosphatase family protein [Gemmatimonadales bacterium]|nr:alkaline phosphatase family protein [Gemmatimonadales bacterium]
MRLLLLAAPLLSGLPAPARPRLVVVVTVDQLRPDYLDRYRRQLIGGLGLLLSEGAVFSNAFQDHAVSETAPGHASILSGRWPEHTGIMLNSLGVQDSSAPLLEVPGPPASPARFRGTTLFDWLQAAAPGARALSVSRKDRAAILTLGRAKQQVYWYQAGVFTTSRYYGDSLPSWVEAFNARQIPMQLAGRTWATYLDAAEYPEPDSVPYEHGGRDFVFPHRIPSDGAHAAVSLVEFPTMDSLTLAFALEGVRALGLGGGGRTDLLAVGLSTTDAIGHLYGPESREIHDQVVRLDRYLGTFFGQLMVRYGPANVLIVLTADHGVTPFPEWSRTHGHPAALAVSVDTIIAAVNRALPPRADSAPWLTFDTGLLLLRERATLAAAPVDVDSVLRDLADRVRRVPGVARVDSPDALAHADTVGDPVARRWVHEIVPAAGVELAVTLVPYSVWGSGSVAEHGQPSDLDTHVPLLFWGRGVRRGTYAERVGAVDIAPTLAALLELSAAETTDGRPLGEIIAH